MATQIVEGGKTFFELDADESALLDIFAESSEFWSSVRRSYAEWDRLTELQHERFALQRDRDKWKLRAPKIEGKPVMNKRRSHGKTLCWYRGCPNQAVRAVGLIGVCESHCERAATEHELFLASKRTKEAAK
jgi:hypothetical protein